MNGVIDLLGTLCKNLGLLWAGAGVMLKKVARGKNVVGVYKRVSTCQEIRGWDQSYSTIPRTRLRISTAKKGFALIRIQGPHHSGTDNAKSTNSQD